MVKTDLAFHNKLTDAEASKVIDISLDLGFHPNWLMGVMNFESGISASITNAIGSVGLIQFTRDKAGVDYKTINGKKYLLSDLKKMSILQQLDVVKEYYKAFKGKITSFEDLYLCTFFPIALSKPNNWTLETSGLSAQIIAQQNPIFDINKNGALTKGEIIEYFRTKYTNKYPALAMSYQMGELVINRIQKKCEYCGQAILIALGFFFTYFASTI